jgi:hypothetical protein
VTTNESAATFRWLAERLGVDDTDDANPVRAAWNDVHTEMNRQAANGQIILQAVDWVSDFWIARGAVPSAINQLAPSWMPPDDIDHWPDFQAADAISPVAGAATSSNRTAFLKAIHSVSEPADAEGSAAAALETYVTLKASLVPRVFDVPAILTEHVRVWLAAGLGHLLTGVLLAPQDNLMALAHQVVGRLQLAPQLTQQLDLLDQLGDRDLEILYNSRMLPDRRVQLGAFRIGQGEQWRDHWLALCFELAPEHTLAAVRMAAAVMRCPAVVLGLASAIASSEPAIKRLAVGVIRRWLLTLQAMAWLEAALQHTWKEVQPKDLCCFALNAVKPDWPRRVIAVSHRSQDVKPALRDMRAWRSGRFAIDANYVPAWETNIGMIWGLFAATPAVVRVQSPTYDGSIWCRRERELTDYLLNESDFLTQRWLIDIDQSALPLLDEIVAAWDAKNPGAIRIQQEFPPLTEICSPSPMPAWEARMLRASAALRMIHAFIPDATTQVVHTLAQHLQRGHELPGPAPTNNPDGWDAYGVIFREASEMIGSGDELAVRLPDSYGDAGRQIDLEMGQRIPDLQTGVPSLRDVLVAMEWLRVEYPQFLDRRRGDFMAINCQRLSQEQWETRDEVSLHRGLAAMRARLPVPLWIIQRADQNVDTWPLMGEVPVFTEHVEAQFGWMLEAAFDRREAQRHYAQASGMLLAPALEEKCRGDDAAESPS